MSEKPGRYQRSTGGLIGAMTVTVVCVLAFVGWRALFRTDAEVDREPVQWQESVKLAESANLTIAHPRELPDGWIATNVDLRAGDTPRWWLSMLTEDEAYVGIRQEATSIGELVRTFLDKEAVQGEDTTISSDVAGRWQTWSDEGGDVGYSAEVGDQRLLVYGSAPAEEIEAFIGQLTTAD